jgi:hypothetical protein
MLTKIDICSIALTKLGERPIQSFTEDTATAQLARTLYEPTIDSMLASHPWNFAQADYSLTKNTDGDFQLPAEALRVLSTNAVKYSVSGDRISAAGNSLNIRAIIRIGSDKFPPYFSSAAATKMAMEFCMPLTDNSAMLRTLSELFNSELRTAKFIDSASVTNPDIKNFSLLSARY